MLKRYEIRVKGHLEPGWLDWFEGRLPAAIHSSHANDPFFLRIGMRHVWIGKNAYNGHAIRRLRLFAYSARV
jgi:hypothetical protein